MQAQDRRVAGDDVQIRGARLDRMGQPLAEFLMNSRRIVVYSVSELALFF